MKKLLLLSIFIQKINVSSLHPAATLQNLTLSLPTARLAALNALRYAPVAIQQKRQLTDIADLKGCHQLGIYTPTLGALATSSFPEIDQQEPLLATWYTDEKNPLNPLVRLFFYQNPIDLKISITQYDKGIVQAFPPTLVAALLKASEQKDPLADEQKKAQLSEWYRRYTTKAHLINEPYSEKSFKKKAQQFLTSFEELSTKTTHLQTTFALLTVLFNTADNKADLAQFAKEQGTILSDEKYTYEEYKQLDTTFTTKYFHEPTQETNLLLFLEQIMYWKIIKQSVATSYPEAQLEPKKYPLSYKGSKHTHLCIEEGIRAFVNCLLYNPTTGCLDFSLLPTNIQEQCKKNNPTFYAFIQKYSNPASRNYYETSAQEWLALVSELPGIKYHSQNFELYGGKQILKVLSHLFGISPTPTFKALGTLFSNENHTIFLDESDDKVAINITANGTTTKVGTANFHKFHGNFSFNISNKYICLCSDMIAELYNEFICKHHNEVYLFPFFKDPTILSVQELIVGFEQLSDEKKISFLAKHLESLTKKLKDSFIIDWINQKAKNQMVYAKLFMDVLKNDENEMLAHLMLNNPIDIHYRDTYNNTFLMQAIKGHYKLPFLQKLLAAGCNSNAENKGGSTAIVYAILYYKDPYRKEVVNFLKKLSL